MYGKSAAVAGWPQRPRRPGAQAAG